MKKVLGMVCGLAVLLVCSNSLVFAGEDQKGPRIVLEEQEITVMEDEKELNKFFISRSEEIEVFKEARKTGKKIKIKDLDTPILKFFDKNGKVKKEILLKSEKKKGVITENRQGYIPGKFEVEFEAIKKAKVSANGKYGLLDNSTVEWHENSGSTPNGKLILYDSDGNIVAEKKYPRGIGVLGYPERQEMIVSDDGTIVVITNDADEGSGNIILHAYDKAGRELLSFPQRAVEEGRTILPLEIQGISLNGKYCAVRVEFQDEPTVTVFFNIKTKKYWKSNKDYNVYALYDDGRAEVSYKGTGVIFLDLEQKMLGE